MSVIAFKKADDPRDPPVQVRPPQLLGELEASALIPLIAGDLVKAHFALEQWGQNTDPNRWNHPIYRKKAILAVRSCSEVCRHSAESGAEELALAKFHALERELASVDTDKRRRAALIRQFAQTIVSVYVWRLEHGDVLSPVERDEYQRESREDGLE